MFGFAVIFGLKLLAKVQAQNSRSTSFGINGIKSSTPTRCHIRWGFLKEA